MNLKQPNSMEKTPSRTSRRNGFALVVTLTLMILLAVIALGMLSLSSVSLRTMGRADAMERARANARMALLLALGELQKQTGPDQRVTASANMSGTAAGAALAAGQAPANDKSVDNVSKGLTAVLSGTRHWTGVFSNRDDAGLVFTKTPVPRHEGWLVSGAAAFAGGVSPADGIYAVGTGGKVPDETKAVVLAGEKTLGGRMEDYVTAPLVVVTGKDPAKPTGRYAWWIGDEGVKAMIGIPRSLTDETLYGSLTAQRRGWETVAGFEQYPIPSSPKESSLEKLTGLAQIPLLLPGTISGTGTNPLQSVFHSATTDSRAVLSDTLRGGTKVDLSAILSSPLPATNSLPDLPNYPVKGKAIVPGTVAPSMKAPLWDAVKQFRDLAANLDEGSLKVTAGTPLTPAIAPTVVDLRLLLGARIKPKDPVTGTYNVHPCAKVAIALANPYSVPLKWTNDLEIEIFNQTPPGNNPARIFPLGGSAYVPANPQEPAVFNKAVFRIRAATLAPGEARAFTHGGNVKRAFNTSTTVVELVPFGSSAPFDFNNCLELEQPAVFTPPMEMDVRESWQTTLVGMEMKLNGSGLLRRIERFELDNGYWFMNQRRFTKEQAEKMKHPFPLMLYGFQISQPGADYAALMPGGYQIGQRGSTLRTFADFNLRATYVRKPIASYNPPPYFMEINDSLAQLPANPPGGETGSGFTKNLAISPIPWGRSPSGAPHTVLYSIPGDLASLAQLQHADLTGDDRTASVAHQPGYAVGNSYAPPFVKRGVTSQMRPDYEIVGWPSRGNATHVNTRYYDISYLLNASLWDSYFFSTIPPSGKAEPVNPTLIASGEPNSLRDPVKAASKLMIHGAFNINSTDRTAWKAFLASARHTRVKSDPSALPNAAFPRGLEQPDSSATPPTGSAADSFSGYRRLTDDQLDALAGEIVKQVRLRGPFLSVSHFVNRAIAPITAQPALTRSGALQTAIDESGVNISSDGSRNGFSQINATSDRVTLRWKENAPRADMDGTDRAERFADVDPSHPDWAVTSTDNNFGAVASILADQEMLKDTAHQREQGYRSTAIPAWLTQADVLQVIGNSITARSDTFRIRSYGEALDPSGNIVAKAWCEAIVQRTPEYVDPTDPPEARGASLSTINRTYGRRFQIISFRWLSPEEI